MNVLVRQSTPRLDRIEENLKRKVYLRSIGNAGKADIRINFKTQGANIGRSWPEPKSRPGGLRLRDTGQLMRSVHDEVKGDSAFVVATKTERGENVAAKQHYGIRGKLYATRFMTFSDRFKKKVQAILKGLFK